jgi:hypothetical protein
LNGKIKLLNRRKSKKQYFFLFRSKSGVWGMRNEKTENINGYQCKVYTGNNFELVTRTRIEHMSPDDRKAYEAGQASNKNFLGGVFNFLESSSASSSKSTTASATPSTIKSSNVYKYKFYYLK